MHSIAVRAENLIDSIQEDGPPEDLHLQPYFGYSTPDKLIIRGRALEADTNRASNDTPSLVDNLAAMAALFMTKEIEGETVRLGDATAVSDEEGYYRLELPRKNPPPGWTDAVVRSDRTGEAVRHPILVTSPKARYGVISDIDDTVMQTKAWSTRKNLWTSVTGSVGSRYVYPDTATLLKLMAGSMSGTKNPVFYVSSSPWNLHGFLDAVFMANGVVRGPKFLRDFGLDATKMVVGTHGDHKGNAIDTVLAANPDLPFYLIGDSGQHDPVVYRDAVLRHPGRIKGVFIRTPGPGLGEEDRLPLKDIEAQGVQIFAGETFEPLLDNDF
ncbi:MAG: phosphatase domain-containing protein [Pseudomonadota bacterium]